MDLQALACRYDGPVPRYTSYPTAPHFHRVGGDGWYRDWLHRLPADESLSIYLHVPFCRVMCWYCGCHTRVAKDDTPVHAYVAALRQEIALTAKAIGRRLSVKHIHWGGGTPTILPAGALPSIMADLERVFDVDADAERAVEADPRTLTPETIAGLVAGGINRVSLGVQTLSEAIQKRINRIQPFDQVADAVLRLRHAGIARVNMDLMYGLPMQAVADVVATIDAVIGLEPDRLALFGYAHVPWMKPHQQRIDEAELPSSGERLAQLQAGTARLVAGGYRPIGFDHFGRPDDPLAKAEASGRLRRNFQGYTDDPARSLIGFGASAIGALPDGYAQNHVAIPEWERAIFEGALPVAKMRTLSPEDLLRRAAIERLMCDLQLDLEDLLADHRYPSNHLDAALERLRNLVDDGLVTVDRRRIKVTELGRPFVRSVAAAFDAYLVAGETRHARAV